MNISTIRTPTVLISYSKLWVRKLKTQTAQNENLTKTDFMFLPQKTEQGAVKRYFGAVFTQSLSISEASQVNISTIGTPTVVKLTLLTPIKMTNIFIFMVLFTKVHSEVRK